MFYFHDLTFEKIRHCVLANLIFSFGVHLVLENNLNRHTVIAISLNYVLGLFNYLYMLGYSLCWSGLHFSLKIDLSAHTVLDVSWRLIRFFHDLNSSQSRIFMLSKSLCWLWVHLVIETLFKQTHCVSCFTKIHFICLHDLTCENSRHYVLANLLSWFGVYFVLENWFKKTHCVKTFMNIFLVLFYNFPSG